MVSFGYKNNIYPISSFGLICAESNHQLDYFEPGPLYACLKNIDLRKLFIGILYLNTHLKSEFQFIFDESVDI